MENTMPKGMNECLTSLVSTLKGLKSMAHNYHNNRVEDIVIDTLSKIRELDVECIVNDLCNMTPSDFSSYMRSKKHFGPKDYVCDYTPEVLAGIIDDLNKNCFSVTVDMPASCNGNTNTYLYVKYHEDDRNGTPVWVEINGLSDDMQDWIDSFNLEEIAETMTTINEQ